MQKQRPPGHSNGIDAARVSDKDKILVNGSKGNSPSVFTLPQVHSPHPNSRVSTIQSLLQPSPKLYKYSPDQMEIVVLRKTGEVENISCKSKRVENAQKQWKNEKKESSESNSVSESSLTSVKSNNIDNSSVYFNEYSQTSVTSQFAKVETAFAQNTAFTNGAGINPLLYQTFECSHSEANKAESLIEDTSINNSHVTSHEANAREALRSNRANHFSVNTTIPQKEVWTMDCPTTDSLRSVETVDASTNTTMAEEAMPEVTQCTLCEGLEAKLKALETETLQLRQLLGSKEIQLQKSELRIANITNQNYKLKAAASGMRSGLNQLVKIIKCSNDDAEANDKRILELLNRAWPKLEKPMPVT